MRVFRAIGIAVLWILGALGVAILAIPSVLLFVVTGPEYGLVDRLNFFRGLWEGFTKLYPEHDAVDFSTQATKLEVPVYFVQGRYDTLEMGSLLERWFAKLDAPHKELVYAEHSATRRSDSSRASWSTCS